MPSLSLAQDNLHCGHFCYRPPHTYHKVLQSPGVGNFIQPGAQLTVALAWRGTCDCPLALATCCVATCHQRIEPC